MAVKTITIDMESYSLLSSRKRSGESFSKVIKRTLGEEGKTGKNLLIHLNRVDVSDEYLTKVEDIVADRKSAYPEDVNL